MTIRECVNKGSIMLKVEQVETPKLKSRLIMQFILNKDRQYLVAYDNEEITDIEEKKFFDSINKLIKGIPLQYITNRQEFMKMTFYVDENVLIPRADTEVLVEEILKIANRINAKKILDLCTGSGAIAISLAKYIKNSEITATDISEKALNIAKKNAKINEVENQITFIKSDLFEQLKKEKYDIIVSNPPYIKSDVVKTLEKEVQKEPAVALDGGFDGLKFYRKIIEKSYEFLKYKGYICFEIGFDQKEDVINLIENQKNYIEIYSKKDLCDNDRIIIAKLM